MASSSNKAQSSPAGFHSASSGSSKASSMAELMAKQKSSFVTVHKGDKVSGVVTKLTRSEILLDIGTKTEAVVLEKEKHLVRALMSMLKLGDKVEAQVLNPESDNGNTVVSLRRFIDEKMWEILADIQKNHEKIEVAIKGITKGGYLIQTQQGLDGFLPNSHVSFKQDTHDLVGQTLSVMIAEQNRETRKLIVSQKTVFGQEDFDALAKIVKVGKSVDAIVSHITPFGIFVSIPVKNPSAGSGQEKEEAFLDGFIHISEVAWGRVNDLSGMFSVGQALEAIVLDVDTSSKRIELSIKKLTADPYEELLKGYKVDQKVNGVVARITDSGIIIDLGEDNEQVEGFLRKEKIPPTVKFEVGQKVTMTIAQIDSKKHRVYLTPVLLEKPLTYR